MDPKTKRCVRCGGELPEGTSFCLACGTSQKTRPGADTRVSSRRRPVLALTALAILGVFVFCLWGWLSKNDWPTAPSDPVETLRAAETGETLLSGSTELRSEGITVRFNTDLNDQVANYFLCAGSNGYQDFRILSCEMILSDGVLRIRGKATAAVMALSPDVLNVNVFLAGQSNSSAVSPVTTRVVEVIPANTGAGVTVSFDVAAADWSALAATGETEFELRFDNHL